MFKVRPETIKLVKQVYLPLLMCCLLQSVISGDICAEQHLAGPSDLSDQVMRLRPCSWKKQMCCVRDVQKRTQPVNLESRRSETKRIGCSGICVAMQPRELE